MRELQKYLKHVVVRSEKREREEAVRRAKLNASMEEVEREWAVTLAAMPPEKAAVYGPFWDAMRESLSAGALKSHSLSSLGSDLDAAVQDALARTRLRLEE